MSQGKEKIERLISDVKNAQHNVGKDETNGHIGYDAWLLVDTAIEEVITKLEEQLNETA
jgi:hypothetical protein